MPVEFCHSGLIKSATDVMVAGTGPGSKDETAAGFLHCGPQLTVEARKG